MPTEYHPQPNPIASEENINKIGEGAQHRPASRRKDPPQPYGAVRLAKRLHPPRLPAVREDPVQLAHQLGERAPVPSWVEPRRGDVLDRQMSGAAEVAQPPGLDPAEGTFAIVQHFETASIHTTPSAGLRTSAPIGPRHMRNVARDPYGAPGKVRCLCTQLGLGMTSPSLSQHAQSRFYPAVALPASTMYAAPVPPRPHRARRHQRSASYA
jgi:hypothetical protein